MVGIQQLAENQSQEAKTFYQMRAWFMVFKNFVAWLFEREETLSRGSNGLCPISRILKIS